jgi:hypothetical protein
MDADIGRSTPFDRRQYKQVTQVRRQPSTAGLHRTA